MLIHEKIVNSCIEILGLFIGGMTELLIHVYPAANPLRDFFRRLGTHHPILSAADDEHWTPYFLQLLVSVAGQTGFCQMDKTLCILGFCMTVSKGIKGLYLLR